MKQIVLVVEDDHDTRVALRECLEAERYFVITATNGRTALEILANMTAPHVIVLDINMPIMNGDDFLERLRTHPEFSSIPVIQISAAITPQRSGTIEVLRKPIDLGRLTEVLRNCMCAA